MHAAAYRYVLGEVKALDLPPGLVVEIGSRDINGSVRDLFPGRTYVGIDHVPGLGVDVVASGAQFQPDTAAAVVVCTEVLEHAPDAEAICRNAARMLVPGGVFIVTAAGDGRAPHSAVDGGTLQPGEYYANVHALQLESWLSDFDEVSIVIDHAVRDIYATAVRGQA